MAKETLDVLVAGGKATAAPPLGPALGPTGLNIGQIIGAINEKTKAFAGMQVPVKITFERATKTFDITVGTPPTSQLIKKEAGIEVASGNPLKDKVADLKIQQIIKVAQMKSDALLGKDMIQKVKEVCGTCDSMGVLVEGMPGRDAIKAINSGKYVDTIKAGKTELTDEERKALEVEKKHLQEEMAKRRAAFETQAKTILEQQKGKEPRTIRKAMADAGIPEDIIKAIAPADEITAAKGGKK